MRVLNNKQKKILDEWYETIKHESGLGVRDVIQDLMPIELWKKLERINNHETLYDNVNRYINDK